MSVPGHREMANRVFRRVCFKTPAYEPTWGEADETTYPPPAREILPLPYEIVNTPKVQESLSVLKNEEASPLSDENQSIVPVRLF